MADDVPRELWIPEVPYDVADWGARPRPTYQGGPLFKDAEDEKKAAERAKETPARPPNGDLD